MTTYRVLDTGDLKAFVRKRRRAVAGRTVQAKLGAALRDLSRPLVVDLKVSVMAVNVRGVGGGGASRREGTHLAHYRRRPRGGFGLRASIARGAKATVRLSGTQARMTVFMDNRHLPRSQRNLPRHLNNPRGWRHPRFGDRRHWYRQVGEPYFDRVIDRYKPRFRQAAIRAVGEALKELQ